MGSDLRIIVFFFIVVQSAVGKCEMSRCFPFPPPGYERKHRSDELSVLKEAKRKERKEKKERRDRERKKAKDGSGEKHGDKKDRREKRKETKEKHRDKKKDDHQSKEKEKSSISEELTVSRNVLVLESHDCCDGNSGNSLLQVHNAAIPEAKFVQELKRRIREDISVEVAGEKGSSRHKREEFMNLDSHFFRNEPTRKPTIQHLVDESKVEGAPRLIEEKFHRSIVDKGREQLVDRDVKTRDTRKEDKLKIKTEKTDDEKLKNDVRTTAHKNGSLEENIRKRKEVDINGFPYDGEIRPKKSQLQALHQSMEYGRKLEAFPHNNYMDHSSMNGSIITHNLVSSKSDTHIPAPIVPNPHISVAPEFSQHGSGNANEETNVPTLEDILKDASRRHPHPDSKYLSQVLRAPNVGQWCENDDQEWLFSKKDPPRENPNPESSGETRVWSKAVHIESADVYALPYVIPY